MQIPRYWGKGTAPATDRQGKRFPVGCWRSSEASQGEAEQQCFRARLTPKPWRCGQPVPPSRFPRTDAKVEKLFRDWETRYSQACRGYATCRFLAALGNPAVHAAVAGVVALHDEMTGTRAALPLA